MKAYVILAIMLAMIIFTVVDAHITTSFKVQSKDQPNFHPKIIREINGKNLEIVKFQCKLAK